MTGDRTNLIAIGTSRFVLGFALAGAQTILATPADAVAYARRVPPRSIVLLDEEVLSEVTLRDRSWIDTSLDPLIITITATGAGREERLRRLIVSTIGVDLLK